LGDTIVHPLSAERRAIVLASFAAISAVLGVYFWDVHFAGFHMLPGVFSGIALATAIWLWVSRRPFGILIVFVSTVIAWLAAEYIAERTFFFIGDMGNRIGLPNETGIFLSVVPGLVGGLIGSAIITFALSRVCKEFRLRENWRRILMAGTALGVLILFYYHSTKPRPLPLLLPWQMAVAALIGHTIVPRIQYDKDKCERPHSDAQEPITDERQKKLEREINELENTVAMLRDDIREEKGLTAHYLQLTKVLEILRNKKSELAKLR
jgi:hypothetical protein